jgi:hypothetical protein
VTAGGASARDLFERESPDEPWWVRPTGPDYTQVELMPPPPFDLQGHVALVTGGNHGIGGATVLSLASCGAAVVVSFLHVPGPGEAGWAGDLPSQPRDDR